MAQPKKDSANEEKPVKGVKYSEIKAGKGMMINRARYFLFLEIYHYLRPYLPEESKRRVLDISKADLVKKYPKDKQLTADVWSCVFELKLTDAQDIVGRLFEDKTKL